MRQNDFADWLRTELKSQGMSQAKLARATGLHTGSISNVLNGQRKPGADFVLSVARALRIKPEDLYRRAGILPMKPSVTQDPLVNDIVDIVMRLSENDRKEVLGYARFRYQWAEKA